MLLGCWALRLLGSRGSWVLELLGSWALGLLFSLALGLFDPGGWGSEAHGLLGCWHVQKSSIFLIWGHRNWYFGTQKKNPRGATEFGIPFFVPLRERGSVAIFFLEATRGEKM